MKVQDSKMFLDGVEIYMESFSLTLENNICETSDLDIAPYKTITTGTFEMVGGIPDLDISKVREVLFTIKEKVRFWHKIPIVRRWFRSPTKQEYRLSTNDIAYATCDNNAIVEFTADKVDISIEDLLE